MLRNENFLDQTRKRNFSMNVQDEDEINKTKVSFNYFVML